MTERFDPVNRTLVRLPVPHDCRVTCLRLDGDVLSLLFEEDVSCHDSIRSIHPAAQTLTMRFTLAFHELTAYRWQADRRMTSGRKKHRRCVPGYRQVPLTAILGHPECPLDYVAHYAAPGSGQIIVDLCGRSSFRLEMDVTQVEIEWTER